MQFNLYYAFFYDNKVTHIKTMSNTPIVKTLKFLGKAEGKYAINKCEQNLDKCILERRFREW